MLRTNIIIKRRADRDPGIAQFQIFVKKWWWIYYKFACIQDSLDDCFRWIDENFDSCNIKDIIDV